jgi:hypothetical protein
VSRRKVPWVRRHQASAGGPSDLPRSATDYRTRPIGLATFHGDRIRTDTRIARLSRGHSKTQRPPAQRYRARCSRMRVLGLEPVWAKGVRHTRAPVSRRLAISVSLRAHQSDASRAELAARLRRPATSQSPFNVDREAGAAMSIKTATRLLLFPEVPSRLRYSASSSRYWSVV